MFWNYVKIALRNLRKNKAFAAINISGLAIGLTIYVFGSLLVEYERTHDTFFENVDRIYTIGSIASPARIRSKISTLRGSNCRRMVCMAKR